MKKLSESAVTVVVHPPEPFLLNMKSPEEQLDTMRREAEDLEKQIKRHCDQEGTSVSIECHYVCSHCGSPWSEEGESFNGGCCDDDWSGAPWQPYEDSGDLCPQKACRRPPFQFFEHGDYIYFDCKCGEQWERKI